MQLLLLHGPAINSSRQKLISLKNNFGNNVITFEKGSDPLVISAHLMTPSLLAEEQLVVLENPPEDFINYQLPTTRYVKRGNYQLILWFDHELSDKKPTMEWVKNQGAEVLFFPEAKEVSIFPLLDFLGNKDKKAYLELARLKKAGYDNQYLITMVFYLLRSFIISNPKVPSFVKQKIVRQKANFPDIAKIYQKVLEIDFKVKSGLLEQAQAEFLLINKFIA